MQALMAVAAALAGIILGYWLRQLSARNEKTFAEAEQARLTQRSAELAAELAALRGEMSQVRELAERRAGFESLCLERERTIATLTAERDQALLDVQGKGETERGLAARVRELEADLRNERQNLQEKVALLESAKKTLGDQFQALAAEILEQKAKTFAETSQKDLGTLLSPLRDQIKEFRERVEKVQTDSTTGVTELKTLIGALGNLNQALTKEAHNLATALRRDTKAQGNWGETILRNILDKSGLQEGIHYTYQQSFVAVAGEDEPGQRRQTDIVIQLPGGRQLIVDSKVSLNAYNDSVNAHEEKERAEAARRHLSCVREHYRELAGRNYQSLPGIQSPDFVVMFVPVEPAFMLAIQEDERLWLDAYERGVLLAGPTTVLFVVRIVENLWRQEQQAKSVREVMDRGAKLYEKFAAFINDMDGLGRNLRSASQCYEDAKKKLSEGRDNLVVQVEKLRELGVKPKFGKKAKSIPLSWLSSADGLEPDAIEQDLALVAEADPAEETQ